jgi:hypothetical protein
MGKFAAQTGGMMKQDAPHCHAPIHPPAPTPTPAPHPGLPLTLIGPGGPASKVFVGGKPAAVENDMSTPCMLPGCVPGGPGKVAPAPLGASLTVKFGGKGAAVVGGMTLHQACVAPIPGPVGKILPPGAPTVKIGA